MVYGLAILFVIATFPILWLIWPYTEPCSSDQTECCDMGVSLEDYGFEVDQTRPRPAERALEHALQEQASNIIVVIEDTLIASKERISFSIMNVSDSKFVYGDLEIGMLAICVDGRWRPANPEFFGIDDAFQIIRHRIYPGETREFSMDLARWYSDLLPGNYLFTSSFSTSFRNPGWVTFRERIFLEFTIY